MLPVDLDKDGKFEILYASSGRVHAKRPDDSVLWESSVLDVAALAAVDDLDGDGGLDVVAYSENRVFVFSAATGALEWAETEGEMGTLGSVRVGDLNGDKKPDIFLQECGCCGVSSGKTGFAYGFGSGFAAPKTLWTLPSVSCGGRNSMALIDLDGDGRLEATLGTLTNIQFLDGKTGTVLASSPTIDSDVVAYSQCLPVDVDGVVGEELLCIQNFSGAPTSGHRAYLLKYDVTSKSVTLAWSKDVGEVSGALIPAPELVYDLDGDGVKEVILTGRSTTDVDSTFILDATSGATLATLAGQRVSGVAPLESAKKALVLTTASAMLTGWSFSRAATPATTSRWTLAGHAVLSSPDPRKVRVTSLNQATVQEDIDGSGVASLFTGDGVPIASISAYRAATGTPSLVGTYVLPAATSISATWLPPNTKDVGRLVTARLDGFVTVLDKSLKPTVAEKSLLRIGGYYANGFWRNLTSGPIVGALGATGQSVLISDSRGTLLRLDPRDASIVAPPLPVWARPYTNAAAIVDKLDGGSKVGVACRGITTPATDPPRYEVAALSAAGAALWSVGVEGIPLGDVVPGRLDTDGVPDLVFQWGKPFDLFIQTRGVSGASGATLWNAPAFDDTFGRQPAGISLADWNGDGVSDVVLQAAGTRVLSGVSGAQIVGGGTADAYFMPTIFDVDGDGVSEVTLQGGFNFASTWSHDLKTSLWTGKVSDQPFPYGAVVSCGGKAPVLVEGSLKFRSRLKLTTLSGAGAGTSTTMVLAGGAKYADEAAAAAASAHNGQLTSATIHGNIGGSGRPTAMVGSSDGWLYGVDPCSSALVLTHNFNAPVGEPVFGDTDGDGKDEIIVSVGDGYLYGLKQEQLPAPTSVIDTDPEHGITDVDVDSVDNRTTLSGKWDAVAGASSYQVAVVGSDGHPLTTPTWTDVGNVKTATISKLTLTAGSEYFFSVRAVGAAGVSPDMPSDGVFINGTTVPDAGADASDADASSDTGSEVGIDAGADAGASDTGGSPDDASGSGCGCRTAPGRPVSSAVAAMLAALVLTGMRRRWARRLST